jgi:hypothetical protein
LWPSRSGRIAWLWPSGGEGKVETVSGAVLVRVAIEGHDEASAVGMTELHRHVRRCDAAFK